MEMAFGKLHFRLQLYKQLSPKLNRPHDSNRNLAPATFVLSGCPYAPLYCRLTAVHSLYFPELLLCSFLLPLCTLVLLPPQHSTLLP